MGIDDVLRLGHLTLAVDQLSDRPKTRTALLDYMAPEMLSVKPHNEHELALGLLDDSSGSEAEDEEEEGVIQKQQQQQQNSSLQWLSGSGGKQTAAADQHSSNGGTPQQPSRQGSRSIPVLQDEGGEAAAAQQGSRRSSNLMRSSRTLNAAAAAGRAEWEHRWAYIDATSVRAEGLCVVQCGDLYGIISQAKIQNAMAAAHASNSVAPKRTTYHRQLL
jgi:hypothetical protein